MPQTTEKTLQSPNFPTWCPGCGDYGIWSAIKKGLAEAAIPQEQLVIVFGVGCSGNMADFLRCYGFHALHGRSLPVAEGIKLANHGLKVLVVAGDGDTYGEGMGHFIAACRGNHDITLLVHDNQTYGLTTGQAAPTTPKDRKTKSTPLGQVEEPVNPMALAITSGASFVARGYAGNIPLTSNLVVQALAHTGFSLVDVLQPCVTFNKVNTHVWYKDHLRELDQSQQPSKELGLSLSFETEKIPLGVYYQTTEKKAYHQHIPHLDAQPLAQQFPNKVSIAADLAMYY